MSACPRCSSETPPGARFCRSCGSPVSLANQSDGVSTIPLNPSVEATPSAVATSPAYVPPDSIGIATSQLGASAASMPAAPTRRSRAVPVLSTVFLVFLTAIVALGLMGYRAVREKLRNITSDVSVATGSEAREAASVLGDLRYPNSTVATVIVKGGEGGRLVTMETSDSIRTVTGYYQEHIKSPNPTLISDQSVLLGFEDGWVTITKSERKTTILVAYKAGQGLMTPPPASPDSSKIPVIPTPPPPPPPPGGDIPKR